MKARTNIAALLVAMLLLHLSARLQAQGNNFEVILQESFESGIPIGWKEQMGGTNQKWSYYMGSGAAAHEDLPIVAQNGSRYAYFYYTTSGHNSTLYTPFLELSNKTKPTLSFYLWQSEFLADVPDLFRVMYRTDPKGEWVVLREYQVDMPQWTLEELILPSERIQIGFYAQASTGMAAGVALDNIRIENRARLPRRLQQTDMWQTGNVVPSGSRANPIAGVRLLVEGNDKVLTLDKAQFEYTGTAISDIERFSLYYTQDSVFTPTDRIASSHSNIVGNTIIFSGMNKTLETGKNFVWLCADVKANSKHGNIVSVSLPAGGITSTPEGLPSTTTPIQAQSPKGQSTIEESLVITSFETNDNNAIWQLTHDWAIGQPTGAGIGDPTMAYSGEQLLATNLAGGYTNNVKHTAQSPQANAEYYRDIKLHYARMLNLNPIDNAWITVPEIGDTLYSNVREEVHDPRWIRVMLPIERATRRDKVSVQMTLESAPSASSATPGGWNVDNFAITGNRIDRDAGVVSLPTLPSCGVTLAPTTLTVRVRNFGYDDISNFEVGYSFDGGRNYTRKTFSGTLKSPRNTSNPAEIEKEFSFDPVLIAPGYKHMVFSTFLTNDEDETNDKQETKLYVFPTLTGQMDYYTDFGVSHNHWYAQGAGAKQNVWAYGLDTLIAPSQPKAQGWATRINGTYPDTSVSYLESPCYDLSQMAFPVLEFTYSLRASANALLKAQYSKDGGTTWNDIPAATYQENWRAAGWSVNTELQTAYTQLPSAIGTSVKFRFAFTTSNPAVNQGALIRQVNVKSIPYKVELASIASPQSACFIGNVPITINLKNTGTRIITAGTRIPLRLVISRPGASETIQDTIEVPSDIAQNATLPLQSTKTFDFAQGLTTYTITVAIDMKPVQSGSKLSTSQSVEVQGNPSFTLGPDRGTLDPATITLEPLTNIGSGGSYKWEYYKWQEGDPDTTSTTVWTNMGSGNTLPLQTDGYGYYRLTATNNKGCKHVDVIKIVASTQDVQVSSILNLTNACEHPTPIRPKVKVKFVDGQSFPSGTSFNIGMSLNGTLVLNEPFTVPSGWNVGDETEFTFQSPIDLSEPDEYHVTAFTMLNDINRANDSTHLQVNTYGAPRFRYGQKVKEGGSVYIPMEYADTIMMSNPMGIPLQTMTQSPSVSYKWERTTDYANTQWEVRPEDGDTLVIPDNISAYYRVTLTDNSGNNCGSTTKQVYINTKDIGIYGITLPVDTACYSDEGTPIEVRVRNLGGDTYPIGTTFEAEAETPMGTQHQTITLAEELRPNESIDVAFPNRIHLNVNEKTNILVRVKLKDDVNALNDAYSKDVQVIPYPGVRMPIDTLFKAFTAETDYEIIPIYSDNVKSYQWTSKGSPIQDDNGSDHSATFKIKGQPMHEYTVTVSNGFCEASATMVVISQDISIAVLTPIDTCSFRARSYPVKVRIKNEGSDLPAGISMALMGEAQINAFGTTTTMLSHTVAFNETFKSGADTTVTMPQWLNLTDAMNVSVTILGTPSGFDDMVADNNSSQLTAFALGYPTISFIHTDANGILEASHLLAIDSSGMLDYRWYKTSDALSSQAQWLGPEDKVLSRHASMAIGDSIKSASYSIYATSLANCSNTAQVDVRFYTHDLEVSQLVEPLSACSMPDESVVRIKVTNVGDYTMPDTCTIKLGLKVNTADEIQERHPIGTAWAPGQSREFTFNKKVNLLAPNEYSIRTTVTSKHDRITENNQRTDAIEHYQPVVVDLSSINGKEYCQGQAITIDAEANTAGLYAANGTPRYAWSTGASTPSIQLQSDKSIYEPDAIGYTVTVTSGVGCEGQASGSISFRPLPEAKIIDEDNNALGAEVEICEGQQQYLGSGSATSYSWNTGESTASIYATTSGTYTVTVTDDKGCSNSDTTRLTVHELPHIGMGGPRAICDGNPTTLDAGEAQSYQWILPDGTTADTRTVTAATAGKYTAYIVDMHGCSNTDEVDLTVQPSPKDVRINTHTADMTICSSARAKLTASSSSAGVSYKWSNGQSGQEIEVNEAQQYTVTVSNSYGCATSASMNVIHYETTPANVVTICHDDGSIKLKVSNPEVRTYQWSTGSTTAETPAEMGKQYSVTITDGNACQYTEQVTASTPQVSISLEGLGCQGSTVTLISSLPNAQHSWSTGETSPSIKVGQTGEYKLTAVSEGCRSEASQSVTMHPTPTPSIKVSGNRLVVDGGTYSSYSWSSGETTPQIALSGAGSYSVTVTDAHGCTGTAQFTYTSLGTVGTMAANVTAYPNPTSNQLHVRVEADQHERYTLTLYSALGASLWQRIVEVDKVHTETIDVEHLPAGIYILHVSSGQRASSIKVAKE
ncbi:MAG: T9SS type A sorting domain-containing protein [Bacteroidales bacterium]|nr:T9SS type A sorting domain-containing protein [Bacteroidales bacterium]